jgi:hypothetical protein
VALKPKIKKNFKEKKEIKTFGNEISGSSFRVFPF